MDKPKHRHISVGCKVCKIHKLEQELAMYKKALEEVETKHNKLVDERDYYKEILKAIEDLGRTRSGRSTESRMAYDALLIHHCETK